MSKTHSPGQMIEKIKASLSNDTNKPFEEWVIIGKQSGLKKHKALSDWLKAEKGLKHNQAIWVAWGVLDPSRLTEYQQPDELVAKLYSGKKAHLRPIYDAIIEHGKSLNKNMGVVVCKTYSSFRDHSQFAILIPRIQSCIDVELAMPANPPDLPGLECYQGHNEKYTHRVRLKSTEEISTLLAEPLRLAWQHNIGN